MSREIGTTRRIAPAKPSYVGGVLMLAGGAALSAAAYLFIGEIATSFRYGDFPSYSVPEMLADLGITRPVSKWPALQPLIDDVLSLQAVSFLFWFGMIAAWLGSRIARAKARLAEGAPNTGYHNK